MGYSSRKWAKIISKVAARIYFFIIIIQIPLFRFPCRIGICQTPVEVVACQLITSEAFPELVLKALLYPGAVKRSFTEGTTIPSPDQLLRPYKSKMQRARFTTDLRHLEKQVEGILDSNRKLGKMFCNLQKPLNLEVFFPTPFLELHLVLGLFLNFKRKRFPGLTLLEGLGEAKMVGETLSPGKKNPALLKLPSSIITPAEGSDNPADSNGSSPLSNISSLDTSFSIQQDNSIGIIGGVSVTSSLNFAKKLVKDQDSSPPFVLCSDPSLSKEFLSLERSSSPFISGDDSWTVENVRRKRVFLENSGVCCTVMPCHILHSWHDEIKEGCSVPFLNVGECVAKELKEAKLRPLEAGSSPRIGVLATNTILVARFYQEKLENEGFEVVMPDKETVEHTVIPAVEALKRKDFEGAQNLFRIALQVLLVRAVNRVILASDELQQLLPTDDPLWGKCIDPMDALARSSIKHAQSTRRVIN
ncbi:hypothetical protein Salat_1572100 [Sesamum alatum]|uniref:Aspartate racemase n=1 Tax=Sesamum alatum TaxID=300844 RepID=A0AAE2CMV8_9LAMI|nr:hypothetical protein Salat_1572100 [Sesamum alatum]